MIFTVFENQWKSLIQIASEASYVYFLIGQKLIKDTKIDPFSWILKTEACSQTVLPDRSLVVGQKSVKSAKIQN